MNKRISIDAEPELHQFLTAQQKVIKEKTGKKPSLEELLKQYIIMGLNSNVEDSTAEIPEALQSDETSEIAGMLQTDVRIAMPQLSWQKLKPEELFRWEKELQERDRKLNEIAKELFEERILVFEQWESAITERSNSGAKWQQQLSHKQESMLAEINSLKKQLSGITSQLDWNHNEQKNKLESIQSQFKENHKQAVNEILHKLEKLQTNVHTNQQDLLEKLRSISKTLEESTEKDFLEHLFPFLPTILTAIILLIDGKTTDAKAQFQQMQQNMKNKRKP